MEHSPEIGTDISSFDAIDSLFSGGLADPWAVECLANWIDVTVNHARILYALPKVFREDQRDTVLSGFLQSLEDRGLIKPIEDTSTADRIELPFDEIERLYVDFRVWMRRDTRTLREWLRFTTSVRRIIAGRFIDEGDLNRSIRDTFWHRRHASRSQETAGISDDEERLAFDMVIRAAQYHLALKTA
ncbi:MAG TPA: hypothetical protein VFP91_02740 [Vicinamibacterales bacterium]|nr:hypothetical protein [Vicinamibacterales bacterium]